MADLVLTDAWTALPYAGIALAVLVAAFFSGTETGAYRLNRVRLRLAERQRRPGARRLAELLADMPGLICVTLIGHNLAVYVATALMARLWEAANPQHRALYAEIMATLTLAPLVFIFAEIVPKDLYNSEADRLMYLSARPLWAAAALFRALGLVAILKGVSRLWMRVVRPESSRGAPAEADPFPARARLRAILRDSAAEGVVTPYQNELVEKIMNLRDVRVSAAMVPADKAVTIGLDASADQFYRIVAASPYSRLPVLDPTGGDVIGLVRVHDVLREAGPGAEFDLTRFVRLVLDLPESTTVTQAIFALQGARLPMAIVRNVRGQFIGLITLKDLVEEIVGELEAW